MSWQVGEQTNGYNHPRPLPRQACWPLLPTRGLSGLITSLAIPMTSLSRPAMGRSRMRFGGHISDISRHGSGGSSHNGASPTMTTTTDSFRELRN